MNLRDEWRERVAEVLRAHRVNYHHRNVGPEPVTADNLRYTSCEGCDWLGGHRDEAGWESHLADALLAPGGVVAVVAAVGSRHPEDYCHRCEGPNVSWYTPGGAWDPVMRPDGESGRWGEIVCPLCFVSLAGGGTWALIPMKDDGEPWTSADEREQIKAKAREDGAAELRARVEAVLDDMATWCGPYGHQGVAEFIDRRDRYIREALTTAQNPPQERRTGSGEGAGPSDGAAGAERGEG